MLRNMVGALFPSHSKSTVVHKKPECHTGNVFVFKIGNVSIHGGGTSHGVKPHEADIIIPVSKNWVPEPVDAGTQSLFPRYSAMVSKQITLPIITKDMHPPSLSREEWEAIIQDLLDIENDMSLLVFCVGGHGRTGTILSVLYGLTHPDEGDPVAKIRKLYCEKAVETSSQLDYIESMTGAKVESGPSKTYSTHVQYADYYQQGSFKSVAPPEHKLIDSFNGDVPEDDQWTRSGGYPGYQYAYVNGAIVYREESGATPPSAAMVDKYEGDVPDDAVWANSENYAGWEYTNLEGFTWYRKAGGKVPPADKMFTGKDGEERTWKDSFMYPGFKFTREGPETWYREAK